MSSSDDYRFLLSLKYWLQLLIVSLLITATVQQDVLLNLINQPDDRVAVAIQSTRTQLSDKQFYFLNSRTFVNSIISSLGDEGSRAIREVPECIASYLSSSFTSGFIHWFMNLIIPNSRFALLVSVLFQTFLLIFAFVMSMNLIFTVSTNRRMSFGLQLVLGLCALMSIGAFSKYFYLIGFRGQWSIIPEFITTNPDILRTVNPQISWAYSFGFLFLLQLFVVYPKNKYLSFLVVLSSAFVAFCGLALSGLFCGALGLYSLKILSSYSKSREHSRYLYTFIVSTLVLLFGFVASYFLNRVFLTSVAHA